MVFEISYYRKCALFLTCDNSRIGFFIKVFVDTVFQRPYRYMNIFLLLVELNIGNHNVGKCKFYYVNIQLIMSQICIISKQLALV